MGDGPQEHGLNVSLLERLMNCYRSIGKSAMKYAASWTVNYRSHADLLELPSKLFYDSQLIPCVRRVPYHLAAPYPYLFICSNIENTIRVTSSSEVEAELLLQEVKKFTEKYKSWELKDTCIMTPSLKQV